MLRFDSLSDFIARLRLQNFRPAKPARRRRQSLPPCAAEVLEHRTLLSAPTFNPNVYGIATPEDMQVGTILVQLHASDPDPSASLVYAIESGNESNTFSIDTDGNIYLAAPLDYETQESYLLTVSVTDGTYYDYATVTIGVTDVAENLPPDVYDQSFEIAEDAVNGTTVGMVMASDPDNDTMIYSLSGDGPFAIDSISGTITATGTLNYEACNFYTLTVTVTDQHGASDSAQVTISVSDVDAYPSSPPSTNQPPVVNDQSFEIAEDAPTGTVVGMVMASDPDEDMLTYSLSGDGPFTIDPATGVITTTGALDYETTPSYMLTVTVTDPAGASDTATITINVTDVVENEPPVIASFEGYRYQDSYWMFIGTVYDENAAGCTIQFGGYLEGHSTQVNADGTFQYLAYVEPNYDVGVRATAVDQEGLTSDEAFYYVSQQV